MRSMTSNMSSVVTLKTRLRSERWCHPNSRLATQKPFPSLSFSEGMVCVMWLDGSSQQVVHIAHFTSCQAHRDQNLSPMRCSVLNSHLLKVRHGLKCFKGVWLKHACPQQEILPMVSCIGNWWYLRHTWIFRSDLTLEAEMKSWLLMYWFGFKIRNKSKHQKCIARDKYSKKKRVPLFPFPLWPWKSLWFPCSPGTVSKSITALTVRPHLWEIFKPCLFGFPLPVWLVSLNNVVTSQQLVFWLGHRAYFSSR